MRVTAVIVAGGSSSRMKGTDKLTLRVGGMSVLERSLKAFCGHPEIDSVVAVVRDDLKDTVKALADKYPKLCAVVTGGSTRCLSVRNGIFAAPGDTDYFAIHDGARPFVSSELISRTLAAAVEHGAAAPALPVVDTIKTVEGDIITGTLSRNSLRAVQTPQIFRADAYREAIRGATEAFDDCQLYEKNGGKVWIVEGERDNFKITEPDDVKRALTVTGTDMMPDYRTGHGYDVHRLVEGRKLILGGVDIPYEKGLLGHSDADVLLHAVADAVLGAAALRDIGVHFPDTDPAYEGADSRILLRECVRLAAEKGYRVSSADATVICQRPKLAGYIAEMTRNIASDLGVGIDRVNVKATTEEKLGFTGDGSGIAAHAVVTIVG